MADKSLRRNHISFLFQIAANTVVGYLFARVLANRFGVSAEKDGFDIAYSVPFIVLNVSGFAFLHAVFTTRFVKLRATNPAQLSVVFCTALTGMIILCVFLLGPCVLFSRQVVAVLGPGLSPAVGQQCRELMVLMLPLVFTLGMGTYFSAALTAHAVPLSAEFCQVVSRVGVIGWLFLAGPDFELRHVAVSLVLASCAGLAIEWLILRRYTGLRFRWQFAFRDPEFRSLGWQSGGFLLAAVTAQCAMAQMRRLATLDGVGTNAMLTYGLSLVTPLSVLIGKPLSLVSGPAITRHFAEGRWPAARAAVLRSFCSSLVPSILVACLVACFATEILQLLYGGGRFDQRAAALTASMCRDLAWSLPASTVLWVALMPILNSRSDLLPSLVFAIGYVAQMAVTSLLFPAWGGRALVAGYLFSINLQALLCIVVVARELWVPAGRVYRELGR